MNKQTYLAPKGSKVARFLAKMGSALAQDFRMATSRPAIVSNLLWAAFLWLVSAGVLNAIFHPPWYALVITAVLLTTAGLISINDFRRRHKPTKLEKPKLPEPVGDRGLSNWRGIHYVDSTYGEQFPGIWLKAKSMDGEMRRIHRCEVKHAGGVAVAPMDLELFGGSDTPQLPETDKESVLFPDQRFFTDGEVPPLPLKSGEYVVTWYAVGPEYGEQFLVRDGFEMNDGHLVWRESTFLTKWECITKVEVVPGDYPMSDGLLTLMAASHDERAEILLCYVIEPDGQRRSPNQPERQPTRSAHYFYPQDFDTPEKWPLPSGDYQVVWQARRFFNDGIRYMPMARIHFHVDMGGVLKIREPEPLMERVDDEADPDSDNRASKEEGEKREDFSWTNTYAADDIRPQHQSLLLTLARIGDRWARGLVCVVSTPDGSECSSAQMTPENQGAVSLLYPENFDAGQPVRDGTYTVTWRGVTDDDPTVAATRDFAVRQVVLSSFWKGNKPGQRLVLEASDAKQVVESGHGNYLTELQA